MNFTSASHPVGRIVVRAVSLIALVFLGMRILDWTTPGPADESADIGGPAMVLLVAALIAGVWAALDGRRHGLSITLVTWVGVGVVAGLAVPLWVAIEEGKWSSFIDALLFLTPFIACLVILPAMLGGAIGRRVGQRRNAPSS